MKIAYEHHSFRDDTLAIIDQANEIIEEYEAQGFNLTLRQAYYQFVARGLLPNSQRSYKRLGGIISNARLAGLISWEGIEDRLRKEESLPHWTDPASILRSAAASYQIDTRITQNTRTEVWCFPGQTSIMVEEGCVPIVSIEEGDRVMTKDGTYERVVEVRRREYSGQLIELKAAGLPPFEVTPGHPLFVLSWDSSRPSYKGAKKKFFTPAYKPSEEVVPRDMLMVPRFKGVNFEAATGIRNLKGSECRASRGMQPKDIEISLDLKTYAVLGLYLAEGSVRGDGRTVQFVFGHSETKFADMVVSWGKSLGLTATLSRGKGTLIVFIYSKTLTTWLKEEFGTGSWVKSLPDWVMMAPFDLQEELVKYHFFGDGSKPDETHPGLVFNTRSKTLAYQEHTLLLRLGYAASLHAAADHGEPMWHVGVAGGDGARLAKRWGIDFPERSGRMYNHIKVRADFVYFPVRKVTQKKFEGGVYNLEVENSHTYCLPCIVHNCEKDALSEVVQKAAEPWDVTWFACRGYVSQSAMWRAAQRFEADGRDGVIIHLGDHDPSGIDMTRDIEDRMCVTFGANLEVRRIALNMDQVREFNPPPNPTKLTDSRSAAYVAKYGQESWELDALDPALLMGLIENEIADLTDLGAIEEERVKMEAGRVRLRDFASQVG